MGELLEQLATYLKDKGYWKTVSPSQQQLASQQPFAMDTLDFTQWLQFIFIVRLNAMIIAKQPLPTAMAIAPMANQVLPKDKALFTLLTEIDLLVSE